MKAMKKLFALLLALTMVFGLAATAFAADTESGNSGTGTIKITNVIEGYEYTAYKMLDLESWNNSDTNGDNENDDTPNGEYAYVLNDTWAAFFGYQRVTGKDAWEEIPNHTDKSAPGFKYIDLDTNKRGYVEWKSDADVKAFAAAAIDWAKGENGITTTLTKTATAEDVTNGLFFNNVELGYYLVDTSLGALCSLGTTDKVAEITAKDGKTTTDKEVFDYDKAVNDWAKNNDVYVGDTVLYRAKIDVKPGAEEYVLHDVMDQGLQFDSTSVSVKAYYVTKEMVAEKEVEKNNEITSIVFTSGTHYTVDTNKAHTESTGVFAGKTCDFELTFTPAGMKLIVDNMKDELADDKKIDRIIVEYKAVVTPEAEIFPKPTDETDEGYDGEIKNEIILSYGDENTVTSETKTRTFPLEVLKVKEDQKTPLDGAKFYLYSESGYTATTNTFDDAKRIPLVAAANTDSKVKAEYKVCMLPQTPNACDDHTHVFEIETNESGAFRIEGLDEGTYYLRETDAPNGYNELHGPVRVVISNQGVATYTNMTYNATNKTWEYDNNDSSTGTVTVVNYTGTEMPTTGGIGTTLFYVFGGLMVVGAAVLLVTKKRMSV